jgi:hypothetical protein
MLRIIIVLALISTTIFFAGCGQKEQPETQPINQMSADAMDKSVHNVLVEEKIDASSYSYLRVKEKENSYWIAINKMDINPGEYVIFSKSMEMKNFKSESLNRTFESILFVDDAAKSGSTDQLKSPHQNITGGKDGSISIEPVKGGYSVEQIYLQKSSLEFKTVKVRGKVIKVNNEIMGTNWVHIQDGTGKDGTHDLLITTSQKVQVGSTIVAEGKVIKDKDFGAGYFYTVLLENSKITVE